jgi:hypothetical protein
MAKGKIIKLLLIHFTPNTLNFKDMSKLTLIAVKMLISDELNAVKLLKP